MATQSTYLPITDSSTGRAIGALYSELGAFVIGVDEMGGGVSYPFGTVHISIDNQSQGYQAIGNDSQIYYKIEG